MIFNPHYILIGGPYCMVDPKSEYFIKIKTVTDKISQKKYEWLGSW